MARTGAAAVTAESAGEDGAALQVAASDTLLGVHRLDVALEERGALLDRRGGALRLLGGRDLGLPHADRSLLARFGRALLNSSLVRVEGRLGTADEGVVGCHNETEGVEKVSSLLRGSQGRSPGVPARGVAATGEKARAARAIAARQDLIDGMVSGKEEEGSTAGRIERVEGKEMGKRRGQVLLVGVCSWTGSKKEERGS